MLGWICVFGFFLFFKWNPLLHTRHLGNLCSLLNIPQNIKTKKKKGGGGRQACWTIEPLWPICDCQKIQNSLTENVSLGINSLNQHDLKHKVLIIICMAGSPSNRKYTRSHRYYWDFPSSFIWGFLAVAKSRPAPVMFKLFCTCGSWAWKLFRDLKGWKYYITPQLNNQLFAISFLRKSTSDHSCLPDLQTTHNHNISLNTFL